MKFLAGWIAALATLWGAHVVAAETAYVIDKLLVGVHQERDLNSAIVKVLPTGTELEILQRDGELAEVKDDTGVSGWVDAAYLMEEAPAAVRLKKLAGDYEALQKELDSGPGEAGTQAARDRLTKENTELKGKLSAEKLKVGELQAAVASLEAKVASRPTTPADTIIEELEASNRSLARDLEAATQKASKLRSDLNERKAPLIPSGVAPFSTPMFVGLGLALLFAFGLGVYLMDYLNRRRHGGFRI